MVFGHGTRGLILIIYWVSHGVIGRISKIFLLALILILSRLMFFVWWRKVMGYSVKSARRLLMNRIQTKEELAKREVLSGSHILGLLG